LPKSFDISPKDLGEMVRQANRNVVEPERHCIRMMLALFFFAKFTVFLYWRKKVDINNEKRCK
jgi:hypothetical protein